MRILAVVLRQIKREVGGMISPFVTGSNPALGTTDEPQKHRVAISFEYVHRVESRRLEREVKADEIWTRTYFPVRSHFVRILGKLSICETFNYISGIRVTPKGISYDSR